MSWTEAARSTLGGAAAVTRQDNLRDRLGDDLWRVILSKMDLQSCVQLGKVSAAFRELVYSSLTESWEKWNTWKNQVPLYPPEVSGYSTAAKGIDKLLFERLVCLRGPQTVTIGAFDKESRRFVHWRAAAMSQNVPGLKSSCIRGESRYKHATLELPQGFSFENLISSQPPEAQVVLDATALICFDCGQDKVSSPKEKVHQNYCAECYVEEKTQNPATWLAMLHPH